jgi:signal transduction histidine kinase
MRRLSARQVLAEARPVLKPTETAAAADELVNELLSHGPVSAQAARQAIERLHTRTRAASVAVWSITDTRATRIVGVGDEGQPDPASVLDLDDPSTLLERLRRHGAVTCHSDEVSGLEDLVSEGVRSFVVAATPRIGNVIGALVIGWGSLHPPCDESTLAHLRVAAALLHRALTSRPVEPLDLADAILGSLADRIAVLDQNGQIVATNAAWTVSSPDRLQDSVASPVPAANYFDLFRREADEGSFEAAPILEGIQAVARGDVGFYNAAYPSYANGQLQWCVLTATRFQHPDGGVVVAQRRVTALNTLASRMSEQLFQRLADALPVPIWVLSPDGRLLLGNARWGEIVSGRSGRSARTDEWTDAFHPDDRERAIAAFRAAVPDRAPFEVELRLRVSPDVYKWAVCVGAPSLAIDGSLQDYVGFCWDISAQRRAESSLRETASKLLFAQEAERSHIGRELHDDLGQRVALLAAKLVTLARLPRTAMALRGGLEDAQLSVQELAVAVHNLSHQLHPAKLRLLGLVNTLDALCRDVSTQNSLQVRFRTEGVPPDVPERIAVCVFHVAQEALQNAVKHSAARDIDVSLIGTASQLTLRVTDTGRGFDPLASVAVGIGLLTMRERVELSGGQLTIRAADARGTTIEAILPLSEPDAVARASAEPSPQG